MMDATTTEAPNLDALGPVDYLVIEFPAEEANLSSEIATELVLSEKTVERHLSHIFTKLQVSSRAAAVRMAVQAGIA